MLENVFLKPNEGLQYVLVLILLAPLTSALNL